MLFPKHRRSEEDRFAFAIDNVSKFFVCLVKFIQMDCDLSEKLIDILIILCGDAHEEIHSIPGNYVLDFRHFLLAST